MCNGPRHCWTCVLDYIEIAGIFDRMWERTYSTHTFFHLIEREYTVMEEKEIYQRLKREGLMDNW
jgi:hypothetical protein